MNRISTLINIFLFDICGPVYVWILVTLGKTQISKNYIIKGIGYLPAQFARLFGLHAIRLSAYISRRSKEKKEKLNNRIKNNELRSYLYIAMSVSEEEARKLITPKRYRKLLEKERLETDSQYAIAHQLFSAGKLNLACETFIDLIENAFEDLSIDRRLQLYRDCGIAHFMHGKIHEAKKYWALAGELKRFILGPVDKSTYRIIGNSWFVAIGHVALLDYYLKYVLLFRNSTSRTIIQHDITNIPGSYLLNKFKGSGIEFLNPNDPAALESDYNSWANQNGKQLWAQLSVAEKAAHIDDFWEFEFPDNQILGYAHAAARIQNEWEHRALPPLLHITKEERKFVYSALKLFGIPQKAWYVCLHVREPGFHKQWNKLYPSMRDADIDDYKLAIEKIVKSGGWVIRMGDPTMKKLPKMKGVVDYAHSPHKTNTADILIPLCCRFFLGTNSGYSTIPHIYGIRCAFTNWVPIGLPLWSKRDLMIPKLFQNQKDQKFLGLEEIFETGLAFVQNWADLPKGISLVENSPEEIKDLTQEMLSITDKNAVVKENSIGVLFQDKYRQMAEHHGGYAGSQIGSAFIENHPDIFPIATTYEKTPMNSLKKGKDVSDLYVAIASSGEDIKKFIDPNHYQKMLKGERLDAEIQYSIAHQLSSKGKLKLACETFVDLIENVIIDLPLERRLQLYRDCGIAYFLCGNNHETKKYWTLAGKLRRFILGPTEKKTYRIIGNSWFAAIGHVCMLDYYLKYIKLFRDSSSRTVIQQNIGTVPGSYLLSKFNGKDIEFLDSNKPEDLEKDYNSWAEKNGKRTWNNITASEKAAHIDDFWEFEFPDGEILGYTHATAKIQQEWERRKLPPLLSITKEEKTFVSQALELLGKPKNSWYVCLHVREPGFHKSWNELYPSMRDADIDDYKLAIEKIVESGGWVIRMGDPTMKKLPKMKGVIDYAHSPYKTTTADILIPLCCRFLLGTNSGYATIPAIYGVRCAFTNWVPIGLPLWQSQDLMIPKLFWNEKEQRHLELEEIFETGLAFVQNWIDLPKGVSPVKNSPEEISDLSEEMIRITEKDSIIKDVSTSQRFHSTYQRLAESHGSYVGCHIGSAFIEKYPGVFINPYVEVDNQLEHKTMKQVEYHEQNN